MAHPRTKFTNTPSYRGAFDEKEEQTLSSPLLLDIGCFAFFPERNKLCFGYIRKYSTKCGLTIAEAIQKLISVFENAALS